MPEKILVAGPSGSGKSTLARYFQERGHPSLDADELPGLAGWVDLGGNPKEITRAEWENQSQIQWAWNRARLREVLDSASVLYLFGDASNRHDFDSWFPRRYWLHVPPLVLEERVRSPTRG